MIKALAWVAGLAVIGVTHAGLANNGYAKVVSHRLRYHRMRSPSIDNRFDCHLANFFRCSAPTWAAMAST